MHMRIHVKWYTPMGQIMSQQSNIIPIEENIDKYIRRNYMDVTRSMIFRHDTQT